MAAWIAIDRPLRWVAAGILCGCAVPPRLSENPDWQRYEVCEDPEGARVLDAANAMVAAGRDREAAPLLLEVLELCPDHVPTHLLYQDTCLRLGGEYLSEMQSYYRDLRGPPPDSVAGYMRIRLVEHDASRLLALDQLLEADPGFYYGHFSKARLLRFNGQLSRAVQGFRDTLQVNPDMLQAHLELAEVLVELRRLAEARPHYANYVRGRPADWEARREYVRLLLYGLGEIEEAEEHVAALVQVDPDDPDLMMDRAALAWRSGRLEEAEALYRTVLDRDPTAARALLNLGNLYYEGMGQTEEDKRLYWPLARQAYQGFLNLARAEGAMDLFDYYLAVPFRLKEIDRFLDGSGG